MRYVIVRGGKSAGKATTINEVCRQLLPERVYKIDYEEDSTVTLTRIYSLDELADGTYIITVRKKNILIVSGAPTQQKRTITSIIESVQNIDCFPEFALIAMSGLEKLKDFKTSEELENFGKCILETKIWRIPAHKFTATEEWKKRISYLTAVTLHNI